MKLKKLVKAAAAVFAMTMMLSSTALAYNYTDYEFTDDGFICVKNMLEPEQSKVVLYMYADVSDRNIKSVNSQYSFYCTEGAVVPGRYRTNLIYKFSPFNAKVFDTLENGEVWVWQFAIENGDYVFSDSIGSTSPGTLPNIFTLNSVLEFPYPLEGYGVTTMEDYKDEISVENETIRIYAMYGAKEWREANVDSFVLWAKETESGFTKTEQEVLDSQVYRGEVTQETIIIEQNSLPTENGSLHEEQVKEIEEVEESNFVIPSSTEEAPKEENSGLKTIITGIGAVSVFAILGFVVAKKKS